ncbi:FCD domain-containing protein [Agromyces sp. CFH 90414]|uniref:FCD domain-containing protein n=1 Tax=Agromyces agglutinans TaxID=2662258 RepID=A0A6I2FC71_9MICO|nr:GntR family transcriptional regulator [Agromyces agglutinans]MRG60290.1 FCD domain-containing protein [Agromyces agglutinans]
MTDPLSTFSGLKRGLLSDQIYDLIKAMIKDTTLEPGEQLVESQLARRLQVSQAPVRDALKRLAHEGLVTHIRHQGNFVASYTDEEAEQAKVARSVLEGLAGELACGQLDAATTERLEGLIEQMHEAAADRNFSEFRELDFAFHRSVIEASGNAYLPRMWDIIEPSLRSMHVLGDPKFGGDWHEVAEWHRSLLELLQGDDGEAAAKLFRAHAAGTLLDDADAAAGAAAAGTAAAPARPARASTAQPAAAGA